MATHFTDYGAQSYTCRANWRTGISNGTGSNVLNTGWEQSYNQNSSIYSIGSGGVTTLIAGTFVVHWNIYSDNFNTAGGYVQEYIQQGGVDTVESYAIRRVVQATGSHWQRTMHSTILKCSSTNVVHTLRFNRSDGDYDIYNGANDTLIYMTYISPST